MKILLLAFGLALAPALAGADPSPPSHSDLAAAGARLVPALRDGKPEGLKVYAIRPGSRFDAIGLRNGDTILRVDGVSVVTDAGAHALVDKVIAGKADATIAIRRKGAATTIESKAIR